MHPKLRFTPELAKQIETRRRKKALVPVTIGDDPTMHYGAWASRCITSRACATP
jgi:hypothetical protein